MLELDTSRNESSQRWPEFLPDGRHLLYVSAEAGLNTGQVAYAVALDSRQKKRIAAVESNVSYVRPGFILFVRENTLFAQPYDARQGQIMGDPVRVASPVAVFADRTAALFSTSPDGVLAYCNPALPRIQLAWFTRDGTRVAPVGQPGYYRQIALSPDGTRLAIDRVDSESGGIDIWVLELSRGVMSRVTFDPAADSDPVWSPSGRELAFSSNRKGAYAVFRKALGGSAELLIFESGENSHVEDWFGDDDLLFIGPRGHSIYRLLLTRSPKPRLLTRSEFWRDEPHVSPDGRLVAYGSTESGRWEVYIASFPSFNERRQVSNSGGCQPMWCQNGRELLYLTLDGKLMSVAVENRRTSGLGAPKVLFPTPIRVNPSSNQFAAAPNGRSFIISEPIESERGSLTITLNWTAGLTR